MQALDGAWGGFLGSQHTVHPFKGMGWGGTAQYMGGALPTPAGGCAAPLSPPPTDSFCSGASGAKPGSTLEFKEEVRSCSGPCHQPDAQLTSSPHPSTPTPLCLLVLGSVVL